MGTRQVLLVAAGLTLAGGPAPARAESLRCNGTIASVGDSRLSVLHKCGEPAMRDTYCAPAYFAHSLNLVPYPVASAFVPCLPVDEWVYDRGPGHLMATVRFRYGVVQAIEYGRSPQ
jgi:hypothetical protein